MSAPITITGRLGADPELRFTQSGAAVASLRIVTDRRFKNAQTGEWESKDTSWWSVQAWKQLAENVAESLSKGDLVIVVGDIKQREYETREGEKRTVVEVEARHVGPDLSRATARVTKAGSGAPAAPSTGGSDPWATPPQSDEAPF
jgi:single-strand DNA-binding protein